MSVPPFTCLCCMKGGKRKGGRDTQAGNHRVGFHAIFSAVYSFISSWAHLARMAPFPPLLPSTPFLRGIDRRLCALFERFLRQHGWVPPDGAPPPPTPAQCSSKTRALIECLVRRRREIRPAQQCNLCITPFLLPILSLLSTLTAASVGLTWPLSGAGWCVWAGSHAEMPSRASSSCSGESRPTCSTVSSPSIPSREPVSTCGLTCSHTAMQCAQQAQAARMSSEAASYYHVDQQLDAVLSE